MTPAAKLRELLATPGPIVIAGAHNGLSARLAQHAGFEGIWASGFEISASYGIPDANILTMDHNLQIAREMASATPIPVVADCDNGYGNAVNVIHMVRQYEAASIAAVCIEDNVFPKRCSFYAGVKRELASVEEHAGKIRAAKEAQRSKDFVVIARTEALIAGWGMDEALSRGRAYADAGADMVLIHSKSKDPGEVIAFAKVWDRKTPLVCVPTTYKDATVQELHKAGFKLIIFANHGLRSSIKAMKETFATMRQKGSTGSVENNIVPMTEVYEIVGVQQMKAEEKAYMPADGAGITTVVLAAGMEPSLMPLIAERPRAMLDIRGKAILEHQVEALNRAGLKDIAVVRGYKKDLINLPNIRTYDNDEYEKTGEVVSLFKASSELNKRVLILYGDVLFEQSVLEKLLRSTPDIAVLVDRSLGDRPLEQRSERVRDYVVEETAEAETSNHRFVASEHPRRIQRIGEKIKPAEANGEFVGMVMLSERGCRLLQDAWNRATERSPSGQFHEASHYAKATLPDLLQEVIDAGGEVHAVDIYKGWMEIDTFEDYQRAWATLT